MNGPRVVSAFACAPPRRNGRWLRWVGSALLLGLVACGSEPPPAPAPAPAPEQAADFKVVVLGDSITAGLGLPVDRAFPAVVQQTLRAEGLDLDVQNAGVSGDTSTAGAARVNWLLKQKPDVLVVELGGNDLLRGQPVAVTEAKLDEIVAAGVGAGAKVVLLGITAPGSVGAEHKAAFDSIYPKVAEKHGAILVPGFLDGLMGKPHLLQGDGLHPTADGQKVLAEALVPVVRQLMQ